MIKALAKVVSYVFHPLVMPFLGIVVVFNSGSYLTYYPFEGQKAIYTIVLLSTIVLPLCFIPFFMFFKLIKTVEMTSRKERIIPYFITLAFYYFAYFILKRATAPNIIVTIILASIIALSCTLVVSFKWKISAHMIGIGGLTGGMLALSDRMIFDVSTVLIILVLISGLLGTARLYLNAHKPFEIYSGFGIGSVVTCLVILYL